MLYKNLVIGVLKGAHTLLKVVLKECHSFFNTGVGAGVPFKFLAMSGSATQKTKDCWTHCQYGLQKLKELRFHGIKLLGFYSKLSVSDKISSGLEHFEKDKGYRFKPRWFPKISGILLLIFIEFFTLQQQQSLPFGWPFVSSGLTCGQAHFWKGHRTKWPPRQEDSNSMH